MIVVLDNGHGYSMRKIWFVDVPDDDVKLFCEAIEDYAKREGVDPKESVTRVVARGSLEWWNGKPLSIQEFLKDADDTDHECGCEYWQYDDETPPCVCWIGKVKELAKGGS